MISFENFRMEDGTAIYQQILLHIKRGIIAGSVQNGDELPSRRMLSALLGVNPNTVQKACRLLEEEGLIQSHSGAKSYVVLHRETVERIRHELVEADAANAVRTLRAMGISLEQAKALMEKYWEDGEEA